jgi:hypothetical protein
MHEIVTVTQRFPTWAAANETRDRLAQNGGFERYGIERIDIERSEGEFELLIRTSEFHRDHIEHLLRSSGTMFNAPAGERPWAQSRVARSLMLFGTAAVAGAVLYGVLGRRDDEARRRPAWRRERPSRLHVSEAREEDRWQRERFESDQREGMRSHAEGYAV